MKSIVENGVYIAPAITEISLFSTDVLCESGFLSDYDVINPWDGVSGL